MLRLPGGVLKLIYRIIYQYEWPDNQKLLWYDTFIIFVCHTPWLKIYMRNNLTTKFMYIVLKNLLFKKVCSNIITFLLAVYLLCNFEILKTGKLVGSNYDDWYCNLRIVLMHEKLIDILISLLWLHRLIQPMLKQPRLMKSTWNNVLMLSVSS